MSEIAAALSLGAEFDYKGRTYRVAPCCYKVQGLFEVYLKRAAKNEIMASAEDLPDYVVREMLTLYTRDAAARAYHFRGSVAQAALTRLPGRKYLAVLQLHKGTVGLDLEQATNLVEEIYDGPEAVVGLLEQSMDEANALPNQPKPYTPTT